MDNDKIAKELVAMARELTAGDMWKDMHKSLMNMDKVLHSGRQEGIDAHDAVNALAQIAKAHARIKKEFDR